MNENESNIQRKKTARAIVLDVLLRCERGGYSDRLLDSALERYPLSPVDRTLVTQLTYGVIERKITLDYIISRLSSIPDERIERETRILLRMGIYQLRYMSKIPPYAALYETVSLSRERSKGFINAVLRAYTRKRKEEFLPETDDLLGYMSVKYSVGESLCSSLLCTYGAEECEKILGAINESSSRLTLRVNTLKCTRDELISELRSEEIEARPTPLSPDGVIVDGGASVSELACIREGRAMVQDEASQICVRALGALPGETVIDACACPGSKSFGAAMTMENSGEILAYDIHESKLSLVLRGAEGLGISIITAEAHDSRGAIPELAGRADRIICDVPCSGFGVIGKKPELRYKRAEDCLALPKIQSDILENVSQYLRVGGTLVYSTCTVLPEENEHNVEKFLARHPEFSLTPFSVGELTVDEGQITLLPHIHGTDGFFIARLTKNY